MKKNYWLVLLFLLSLTGRCLCQPGSAQEEAMQLYSEGNYYEALIRYKKLITLFPKDPKYYYYSGACMVQTNTNLNDAIKNLLYASEYAVPRDVYYYLGKAYHYQYKFGSASDAYQKYKDFGNPSDQEKTLCEMYISMARNGQSLFNYIKIRVLDKKQVDLENLYSLYNNELKNGQFKAKPEKLIKLKETPDNKAWRYEPYLSDQDIIAFGSNQTMLKRYRDIYQTKKLKGKQWSRPEILSNTVNTPYDEDYVYFNEAEPALYFASKGHNSMGGYDIFKTVYNPDYKTWSAPINMGYPINSPYNDYLFVPSDDQKTVCFTSDRETTGNKVMVYKIAFEKNYTFSNIPAGFVFKNVLSPDSMEKSTIMGIPFLAKNSGTTSTPYKTQAANADSGYNNAGLPTDNYTAVINNALSYQLKCDSINYIISEQRELLNNSDNESDKTAIKSKIYQLNKQARKFQSSADSLYVQAREYENNTVTDEKLSGMTVTADMAKIAFAQGGTIKKTDIHGNLAGTAKTESSPALYEFKVMAKSPYKSTADIPVNQPLPNGVVYRVQMGAFSKTIEPNRFKGIVPINGETISNTAITKYYAGLFGKFADAENALNKIKEYGFKDAFIVSYYNKKPVPTNRAMDIEKGN